MATLSNRNGRRIIQFPATGGGRKTIYLGKMDRKSAEAIRSHIDHIISCNATGQPLPLETATWLGGISNDLHAKMVKAALIQPRAAAIIVELGPFIERYIESRTDLKPRTISNLKQVQRGLLAHFSKNQSVPAITRGDMGDWHRGLKAKLAAATVAMHVKKARQIFANAVDRRLIAESPMKGIKAGSMTNAGRLEFIPAVMIDKVINACPSIEWKLIFALARYGGLRVPSETNALRWSDVRWDESRMTIRSSKTEHHEGKATREIPIFPELLPFLREAFEQAPEGAKHVIARNRGENIRTQAERIIENAGVTQWGKLFQNLRSSRETELTATFPLHVVCAWLGNTEIVARKHYLQVTDDHFAGAVNRAAVSTQKDPKVSEPNDKIPGKPEDSAKSDTPKGSSTPHRILAKTLRIERAALHKTMRRLREAMPHLRQADIARLCAEVDSARPPHLPPGGPR